MVIVWALSVERMRLKIPTSSKTNDASSLENAPKNGIALKKLITRYAIDAVLPKMIPS